MSYFFNYFKTGQPVIMKDPKSLKRYIHAYRREKYGAWEDAIKNLSCLKGI